MSSTFQAKLDRGISAANLDPATVEAVTMQRARLAAIEPPAAASAQTRVAIKQAIAGSFVSGFAGK